MDAEQYKEFEQKMKVADEYDQPLPNDIVWSKMEAKLDATFKKEKKRRGFWIFFIPIFLIGAWFGKNFISGEKELGNITAAPGSALNGKLSHTKKTTALSGSAKPIERSINSQINSEKNEIVQRVRQNKKQDNKIVQSVISTGPSSGSGTAMTSNQKTGITISKKQDKDQVLQKTGIDVINTQGSVNQDFNSLKSNDTSHAAAKTVAMSDTTTISLNKNNTATSIIAPKKETKAHSSLQRFFITGSVAPFRVSVPSNTQNPITTAYGLGVGYVINKKWFVEFGLTAGTYKYSAGPDDYYWQGAYGYKLKDVQANCFIIELPVQIGYNFYEKRRIVIVGGAAIASQFMKEEDYDYTAERNGAERKGRWEYENEHKHFFSNAQLSLGIAYKINDKFIIQAAPFYRVALKGIGEGGVKLNAAGMILQAQYFPFQNKK